MALMGDPNASIPTPQPVHYRPMFGSYARSRLLSAVTFVSGASLHADIAGRFGLSRELVAVRNCRSGISKRSMVHNATLPKIEVDPETYEVRADGVLLVCEPAKVLPMAQRYFMF
jgi:urease subunit alpha